MFPGFAEVAEIGVGSLATVFRAREPETGRRVALKLLNVRDASPRAIESFERESVALGALSSHPNIVTLFRTFRTPDGRPVLVLELCSGAVADRLHGGVGLPVRDAVTIGIKIAGALETAHRGGILHRDVKPQNILVTEFGEPALADFGVAMLQSSTQTTAGLFDFTTLHAAPELLEGGGTSAATDVYELASSLYQLIAGKSAFRAYDGESPASVILRILRDPVRPLMGAGVPMQLSDLLIRAMSKDKEHRPPTAAEFAAELADVEIAEGWPRTQFLIRSPAGTSTGWVPDIVRMPDAVPRSAPGTPPTLTAPAPALVVPPLTGPLAAPQLPSQPPAPPQPPADRPAPVPPALQPSQPPAERPAPLPPPVAAPPPPPMQAPAPPPPPPVPVAAPPPPPPPPPTPVAEPPVEVELPAATVVRQPLLPQGRVPIDIGDEDALGFELPRPGKGRDMPTPAAFHPQDELPPPAPARPAPEATAPPPVAPAPPEPIPAPAPAEPAPVGEAASVGEAPEPPRMPDAAPAPPPAAAPVPEPVPPQAPAPTPLQAPAPTPPPAATPVPEPEPTYEAAAATSWWSPVSTTPADPAGSAPEQFPRPPAGAQPGPAGPHEPSVPTWAVRSPAPPFATASPQFVGDIAIDPNYLRPRLTVRAGLSSLTVDEQHLTLRSMLRKERLPWSQVSSFQPHFPDGDNGPQARGVLVAITPAGAIELPATRRPSGELRHVHALLDAYRVRALMYANS
jgi:serine/threonine protein kinase